MQNVSSETQKRQIVNIKGWKRRRSRSNEEGRFEKESKEALKCEGVEREKEKYRMSYIQFGKLKKL